MFGRYLCGLSLALVFLSGCGHDDPNVFVRPVPVEENTSAQAGRSRDSEASADRENRESKAFSVELLSPQAEESVPQFGAFVRFRLNGVRPGKTRPVVFIRDATGLETNWWAWSAQEIGDGVWEAGVQFGEAPDTGKCLAVKVLVLPEGTCPAPGSVGFLPDSDSGHSSLVEVIRR